MIGTTSEVVVSVVASGLVVKVRHLASKMTPFNSELAMPENTMYV